VVAVVNNFDSSASIWLNSLGISALIGVALILSIGASISPTDPWQTIRLFLMPFCVSSFSALTKDKGYILIFPPLASKAAIPIGLCIAFVVFVITLKYIDK